MAQRCNEIATIDCALITIEKDGVEIGLNTASKIEVEIQTEVKDAVKLVIKGVLKAQKHKKVTVTGNQITLTDNVFTPEVVQMLQGGEITIDPSTGKVTGYTPPVVGDTTPLPIFKLNAYTAIYNAAGICTGYEKCAYPNCQGNPISMSSEDDVFRVNTYTIDSAPNTGEAPYTITYVDELPDVDMYSPVTQNLTNATSTFTGNSIKNGQTLTATISATQGTTLGTITVTMGGTDISSTAVEGSTVTITSVTGAVVITATAS